MTIYTIDHSTHPIDEFISWLEAYQIKLVVDVRTIARSRHNPQFNEEVIAKSLAGKDIDYKRLETLGGLRPTSKHSINMAWKNASFRGYADYMQTDHFSDGITKLLKLAKIIPVAIMCAEAVPWRCHRSMIGDALIVRDFTVEGIMSQKASQPHKLTAFAQVTGHQITYPR